MYVIASKRWPSSGYRLREVRAMGTAWVSASSYSSLLGLNLEYLVADFISSGISSLIQINHRRRGRLSKRSEMAISQTLRWKMVTRLTAYRARLSRGTAQNCSVTAMWSLRDGSVMPKIVHEFEYLNENT